MPAMRPIVRMSMTCGKPFRECMRIVPFLGRVRRPREKSLVAVDIQRGKARGAGGRMAGVGIAVEQLDLALRPVHQRIVHLAAGEDRAHRNGAVGQALRGRHDIRPDTEIVRGKGRAKTAEAGDDLVEDQQDAVPVADRAQALEIAFRRDKHAGRASDRLDNAGRDRFCAVQRDQTLEIVGKLHAVLRLAFREGVAGKIMRVAQMIDAGELRENRGGC